MGTIVASDNIFPILRMAEAAAPATPPTGQVHLYVKSDGLLYWKDDAGTEYALGAVISGLADHLADTTDAHDASAISVLDTAAVFTAVNVETALKELYDSIVGVSGSMATDPLWDAAGDLAVGTGSNTAAKLTVGSTGAVLYVASGTAAWGHPSGSIVQVVRAQSTTDDTTTSASYQASSLSASITPKYSDSIITIMVHGECSAVRAAGTILERAMWVAIQNTTNSVTVAEQVRGVNLIATNAATATTFFGISLYGEYTVNSTAARTFQLQYKSTNASNVQAGINGSRTGGVRMVLQEVRA